MSKDDKGAEDTKVKSSKKGLIMMIVVAIVALAGGGGGAWFFLQNQNQSQNQNQNQDLDDEIYDETKTIGLPTKFLDLDVFTVNLLPEEGDRYLQVGLTVKILETKVEEAITKQMPEIRNRILLLLSSKKPSEISTIMGKQELSEGIAQEIRESLDSRSMQREVIDVLFTSFVIQ